MSGGLRLPGTLTPLLPPIGGDLLLVAVAMVAHYDFGLDGGRTMADWGILLWPDLEPRLREHRVREALRGDIRTYRPPPLTRTCTAPMQRRAGVCGKPAVVRGYLVDWGTGEMRNFGGCSRHRFGPRKRGTRTGRPNRPSRRARTPTMVARCGHISRWWTGRSSGDISNRHGGRIPNEPRGPTRPCAWSSATATTTRPRTVRC